MNFVTHNGSRAPSSAAAPSDRGPRRCKRVLQAVKAEESERKAEEEKREQEALARRGTACAACPESCGDFRISCGGLGNLKYKFSCGILGTASEVGSGKRVIERKPLEDSLP